MRPPGTAKLLIAPLLVGCLAVAGCIRVGDFSRNATRYNEAIEEAQNRMLLLNVVRSAMHRPMYITDLSKITGNIKLDVNTGGVETDYGPFVEAQGSTVTSTPAVGSAITTAVNSSPARYLFSGKFLPSLDYAHSPTFDVNVLSTQDFMNGFLKPTSKDLIAYYWEQGWPKELLLYLFVREVQVRNKDSEVIEHYTNYPSTYDHLAQLEAFGHWVTTFIAQNPVFVRKDQGIGPCLDTSDVSDLKDLVAASKEGLGLTQVVTGKYQLQQAKPDLTLMSEEQAKAAETEKAKACQPADTADGKKSGQISAQYSNGKFATLILRAPEGILYYLGELMRVEQYQDKEDKNHGHYVPEICVHDHLEPLFVAFARTGVAKSCKEAIGLPSYRGVDYLVPEGMEAAGTGTFDCQEAGSKGTKYIQGLDNLHCSAGRSMEALSLVTQLISLQKSAKDSPTTAVIRAIAQ